MRGKGLLLGSLLFRPGITPAYAGKSNQAGAVLHKGQDHPRLCGEKPPWGGFLCCYEGSPPPMRGKGPAVVGGRAFFGITPAYAGKSKTGNFFFCAL